MSFTPEFNPDLDLVIERVIDLPPEAVFKAWTTPEIVKKWFCPRPWTVPHCEINLQPGGRFNTTMKSPEGQEMQNYGAFLEIIPNKKLVWTDALTEGYRPSKAAFITVVMTLEDLGGKTKYRAHALHKSAEDKKTHMDMGFEQGWGICIDQMTEVMKNM